MYRSDAGNEGYLGSVDDLADLVLFVLAGSCAEGEQKGILYTYEAAYLTTLRLG